MKRDVLKLKKQLNDKTQLVKTKESELKIKEKEVLQQYSSLLDSIDKLR